MNRELPTKVNHNKKMSKQKQKWATQVEQRDIFQKLELELERVVKCRKSYHKYNSS